MVLLQALDRSYDNSVAAIWLAINCDVARLGQTVKKERLVLFVVSAAETRTHTSKPRSRSQMGVV
jgi:hypothetical protein